MRRKLLAVLGSVMLLAFGAGSASAITRDYVNDFEHPFVGLLALYDSDGVFQGRCSGSLISSTVFITAGHCVAAAGAGGYGRIWFQQDAGAHYDPVTQHDPVTGYPDDCASGTLGVLCATSHSLHDFNYTGILPDTHDVGLLVLDQAINLNEYAQLPTAGQLDSLARARGTQDTTFSYSGYGLSLKTTDQDAHPNISFRVRLMATAKLTNLTSALNDGYNLQTNGHGTGNGGTCNGDSGGPVFLGGTSSDLMVAVTSFGLDPLCRGTDFEYRLDRQPVLDWIAGYLD